MSQLKIEGLEDFNDDPEVPEEDEDAVHQLPQHGGGGGLFGHLKPSLKGGVWHDAMVRKVWCESLGPRGVIKPSVQSHLWLKICLCFRC